MSLYRKTVEEISRNKSLREEGKDISIPSPFEYSITEGKNFLSMAQPFHVNITTATLFITDKPLFILFLFLPAYASNADETKTNKPVQQ